MIFTGFCYLSCQNAAKVAIYSIHNFISCNNYFVMAIMSNNYLKVSVLIE